MPTDVQINPAILATSEQEYKEKLEKIQASGLFNGSWVQIDFTDNEFVQNKSVSPVIAGEYPTQLKIEAHLMMKHPTQAIFQVIKTGAGRVVVHVESDDVGENLAYIEDKGVESGLAINPETPMEKLTPYLNDVDIVLIMSVHPGTQGRDFIPESLEKIKECSRYRLNNNLNYKIGVDGGISSENAKLLIEAGADYLVVGSHLTDGNIAENLEKIRQSFRD